MIRAIQATSDVPFPIQLNIALNAPLNNSDNSGLSGLSGTGTAVDSVTLSTPPPSSHSASAATPSVDVAGELARLIQAKLLYTANAQVVRAANQLLGALFNQSA